MDHSLINKDMYRISCLNTTLTLPIYHLKLGKAQLGRINTTDWRNWQSITSLCLSLLLTVPLMMNANRINLLQLSNYWDLKGSSITSWLTLGILKTIFLLKELALAKNRDPTGNCQHRLIILHFETVSKSIISLLFNLRNQQLPLNKCLEMSRT